MPAYTPGRFVWHELITPDIAKSKGWYGELFGWSYSEMSMPDMTYTVIQAAGAGIGGVMPLDAMPRKDIPPHWIGYVSADADAVAAATRQAGGTVLHGPFDVSDVGRITVFSDPTGGVLASYRSAKGDEPEPERPGVGTFCWDQLNTTDPAKAGAFYATVLGWKTRPFDGAPDLQIFQREGGKDTASLLKAPPGAPSHWLTYVLVPNLSDARQRAVRLGGKVHLEHHAVPGVGSISVVADTFGAVIGLFEPNA